MKIYRARLATAALCLAVLFWFIPYVYLRSTRSEAYSLSGEFSPITGRFIIFEHGPQKTVYRDETGGIYTSRDAQMLLPFFFAANVDKWGGFPLRIGGLVFNYEDVRRNTQRLRLRPRNVLMPGLNLHLLIDAEPEGVSLELPEEVYALREFGATAIRCADGTENKEKSALFNRAMRVAGVALPIKKAANNATTLKPFDEGLFVIDAADKIFQCIIRKGIPHCRDTGLQAPPGTIHLAVLEHNLKEFYAVLVSKDAVYLHTYADTLQKLPLDEYVPENHALELGIDPLHRAIRQSSVTGRPRSPVKYSVSGPDYIPFRVHVEAFPARSLEREDKINAGLSFLTPWSIRQFSPSIPGVAFIFSMSPSPLFVALGSCVALLSFLAFSRIARRKPDYAACLLVALAGLPGLAAGLLFGPFSEKAEKKDQ